MSLESNKLVARQYLEEGLGRKDGDVTRLFSPEATFFHPRHPDRTSAQVGTDLGREALWLGLPDLEVVVEDLLGEGDAVVARWYFTGTHLGPVWDAPPTGRKVKVDNFTFYRFRDGLIVHTETLSDRLDVGVQLGTLGKYAPLVLGEATGA